jgi:hypothetical protein
MLDSPEGVCAGQVRFEYPATFVLFSSLDSRTANRTLVGCRLPRSTAPTSRSWQRFGRCEADGRMGRFAEHESIVVPVARSSSRACLADRVSRIALPRRGTDGAPVARLGPSPVRVQRHHPYASTAGATHWLESKGIDASATGDAGVSDCCSRIRVSGFMGGRGTPGRGRGKALPTCRRRRGGPCAFTTHESLLP